MQSSQTFDFSDETKLTKFSMLVYTSSAMAWGPLTSTTDFFEMNERLEKIPLDLKVFWSILQTEPRTYLRRDIPSKVLGVRAFIWGCNGSSEGCSRDEL